MSPRLPRRSITITSTLRLAPSTPVSTRRKTHPILDPQPAKNSAGHTLITTALPIARQSPSSPGAGSQNCRSRPPPPTPPPAPELTGRCPQERPQPPDPALGRVAGDSRGVVAAGGGPDEP